MRNRHPPGENPPPPPDPKKGLQGSAPAAHFLTTQLRRLFVEETNHTLIQLLRYTLVGGAAYGVDFTTLYLLTDRGGLHYLLSAALAFSAGLVVNYLLSIAWIFRRRQVESRSVEFIAYASIGLVGLVLNELFLWIGVEGLGLHYLVAKVGSAVLIYLWNFFVRKFFLFR